MTSEKPTCKTCPFWGNNPAKKSAWGECRIRSVKVGAKNTTGENFCGEHPDFDPWLESQRTTPHGECSDHIPRERGERIAAERDKACEDRDEAQKALKVLREKSTEMDTALREVAVLAFDHEDCEDRQWLAAQRVVC